MFQVQSYLPLSIANYVFSKHYAGSQVSDRCTLGSLFYIGVIGFTKVGQQGGPLVLHIVYKSNKVGTPILGSPYGCCVLEQDTF